MQPTAQAAIDALSLGAIYALIALGIALIFSIMGLMNFAYGELIMVGAYALFLVHSSGELVGILATVGVCVAAALLLDLVAFRPVRRASPMTMLITSFAVSYLLQNLATLTFGARNKAVTVLPFLDRFIALAGLRIPLAEIVTVVVTVVALGAVAALLRFTSIGIEMRAAAEDFSTARTLGVRANRVFAAAFAVSGVLAAAVATLLVAQTGVLFPTMGVQPALVGFVAAVVGGLGSLVGAVAGGVLLGVVAVVLQVVLPYDWRPYRDAFTFAVVILVLLFRPQGIIAVRSLRRRV